MKEQRPPDNSTTRWKFSEAISRPDALFDYKNPKDFAWVVKRAINAYGVSKAELQKATQFPPFNFDEYAKGTMVPPEITRKFVFEEIAKALWK